MESDYHRQRYQTDAAYFANYISNDKRYLFTFVGQFTKLGWIIWINNKVEAIISDFKNDFPSYLKAKILYINNSKEFWNN